MKAYMAYSRSVGSLECAFLVFANNAKEAKNLAWNKMPFEVTDDFIDLGIHLIENRPWLFDEMTSREPHIVASPKTCKRCDMWGYELNEDGYCESCEEEIEEEG